MNWRQLMKRGLLAIAEVAFNVVIIAILLLLSGLLIKLGCDP